MCEIYALLRTYKDQGNPVFYNYESLFYFYEQTNVLPDEKRHHEQQHDAWAHRVGLDGRAPQASMVN